MARQIIESPFSGPEAWMAALGEPTAQRLCAWNRAQAEALLCDVFGYHALQAGGLGLDLLQANRMPHRWRARLEFESPPHSTPEHTAVHDLAFDSRAWPWPAESLDLVVLPHTLERSADPHTCLREVERVLIPEGQVLITGINPWSLWGRRLLRAQGQQARGEQALAPWLVQPLAPWRVRDWLRLLGFEVQHVQFTGWTPTWRGDVWVQRWSWLDAWGRRWWPVLGGAYAIVATKRVPGAWHLSSTAWRRVPSRRALAAPAARAPLPPLSRGSAQENSP